MYIYGCTSNRLPTLNILWQFGWVPSHTVTVKVTQWSWLSRTTVWPLSIHEWLLYTIHCTWSVQLSSLGEDVFYCCGQRSRFPNRIASIFTSSSKFTWTSNPVTARVSWLVKYRPDFRGSWIRFPAGPQIFFLVSLSLSNNLNVNNVCYLLIWLWRVPWFVMFLAIYKTCQCTSITGSTFKTWVLVCTQATFSFMHSSCWLVAQDSWLSIMYRGHLVIHCS